jgi:flagella basal body P-ring formation protein FlgA
MFFPVFKHKLALGKLMIVYPQLKRNLGGSISMYRLLIGLLIAISCLSANAFLQRAYGQLPEAVKIVYTTQNISAGQIIAASMVEERQMPPDKIPPDAVRSGADAVGRVAKTAIQKGQILSKNDIKER